MHFGYIKDRLRLLFMGRRWGEQNGKILKLTTMNERRGERPEEEERVRE